MGEIRDQTSATLWNLDASGAAGAFSEYGKAIGLLPGRDNPRNLTVYVVNSISGPVSGLHQPLFGSVFVDRDALEYDLAHEMGHAMLALWNAYHHGNPDYLMYFAAQHPGIREIPKLSRNERCTMRRSKWLDRSWNPFAL
jgi:hypothetical protein